MKTEILLIFAISVGLAASGVLKKSRFEDGKYDDSTTTESDEMPEACMTPRDEPRDCYSGARWRYEPGEEKCRLEKVSSITWLFTFGEPFPIRFVD